MADPNVIAKLKQKGKVQRFGMRDVSFENVFTFIADSTLLGDMYNVTYGNIRLIILNGYIFKGFQFPSVRAVDSSRVTSH